MHGRDAVVGGADGDAPGAGGTGEGWGAAAGEAALQFGGIGEEFGANDRPSFANGAFEFYPRHFLGPLVLIPRGKIKLKLGYCQGWIVWRLGARGNAKIQ